MAGRTIVELLRETFSGSLPEDWKHAASQEIEGQNPFDKLAWKNADELTFLPYYDESHVATLNYLKNFTARPGNVPYSGPRHWVNLPAIAVTDAVTANGIAIDQLQQGADGLLFDFKSQSSYNPEHLFQSITWPYCSLSFIIHASDQFQGIAHHLEQNKYNPDTLNGVIYWETLPDINFPDTIFHQANFYFLGQMINTSSPATEICTALLKGIDCFEYATKKNIPVSTAASRIAFSLPTENNFLLTVAKFKALRLLWFQVVRAYGVHDFMPERLHLHARCRPWTEEKFQPHGNMLSGTISALAAICGQCDALTIHAEEEHNIMMNRIARNISSMLREESYLDKVSDPLAGAYAIDAITDDLAKKAWSMFQSSFQNIPS